jgi:hypothetical protein
VLELDMGFAVEEVAQGIGRLLQGVGCGPAVAEGNRVRFAAPEGVTIEIEPMPPDRIHYPTIFFARTLLVIRGGDEAVEAMQRKILLAFLRVGG